MFSRSRRSRPARQLPMEMEEDEAPPPRRQARRPARRSAAELAAADYQQRMEIEDDHDGENEEPRNVRRPARRAAAVPLSQRVMEAIRDDNIPAPINQRVRAMSGLPDVEETRLAGVVIRYMLAADRSKLPITPNNIKKIALGEHASHYRSIMGKVKTNLRTIFGISLCDVGSGKFILINAFPNPRLTLSPSERAEKVLLFFCLAHIFMADGCSSEYDLFSFLKELKIYDESKRDHPYFGNIDALIREKFVQRLYLNRSKVPNTDPQIDEYRWGHRAENEIAKATILNFVAMVHNRPANSWPTQYRLLTQANGEDEESE